MYDVIISFLVTSLRTDITAVSNRVTSKGAYFNPKLPRISVGYPLSLNEEVQFIGNQSGYSSEGDIVIIKMPVEIIAYSAKERDQIGDAVLTSILTTNKPPITAGILDLKITAENNIDDDTENPNVFRKIYDIEITFERT